MLIRSTNQQNGIGPFVIAEFLIRLPIRSSHQLKHCLPDMRIMQDMQAYIPGTSWYGIAVLFGKAKFLQRQKNFERDLAEASRDILWAYHFGELVV